MQSARMFNRGPAPCRLGATAAPPVSSSSPTNRLGRVRPPRPGVPRHAMAPDRSQALEMDAHMQRVQVSLARLLNDSTHAEASGPVESSSVRVARGGRLSSQRQRKALLSGELPDEQDHPSHGWRARADHPSKAQLWAEMRAEAERDALGEPALASFLYSTVLGHSSLEKALAFLLGNKLSSDTTFGAVQLMALFESAYADDPDIVDAAVADILACRDRDPACDKYSQCLLYFKGFQAIQCHRVAHWLACNGRVALALALQSRVSEVLHVDIHPGAMIGRGIMLDHATGVVIGETAVIGDNVSLMHHVTLGGSGTDADIRHPTLGHGVLLGAGVSVLGPVVVGAGSKVGAGSVVVSDLPSHTVAVGVPAKVIKRDLATEPVRDMDQCLDYAILDYNI